MNNTHHTLRERTPNRSAAILVNSQGTATNRMMNIGMKINTGTDRNHVLRLLQAIKGAA